MRTSFFVQLSPHSLFLICAFEEWKENMNLEKRLASLDNPSKCLTFNLNFNFLNADGLYYREKRKTLLSRLESILCVLFFVIEFTYGKILKPHSITLQKLLRIPYHNQFVYVIHVMVWLLNTLPNQHRRLIQYVTEIYIAEKIALSKNEHRKGALKWIILTLRARTWVWNLQKNAGILLKI